MIALQIQDKKKMLQVLLESTSFDTFLMQEVSVIRDSSLFLEGRIHPEYQPYQDFPAQTESIDFCLLYTSFCSCTSICSCKDCNA